MGTQGPQSTGAARSNPASLTTRTPRVGPRNVNGGTEADQRPGLSIGPSGLGTARPPGARERRGQPNRGWQSRKSVAMGPAAAATATAHAARSGISGAGRGIRFAAGSRRKHREFLLQAFRTAVRAGGPLPIRRTNKDFALPLTRGAMKLVNRHARRLAPSRPAAQAPVRPIRAVGALVSTACRPVGGAPFHLPIDSRFGGTAFCAPPIWPRFNARFSPFSTRPVWFLSPKPSPGRAWNCFRRAAPPGRCGRRGLR